MRISLAGLVRKEFLQAFRDPRMLLVLLMAPTLQTIIFGYAANLEFNHANTVVFDEDHTAASRALVRGLRADSTFSITDVNGQAAVSRTLQLGEAQTGLVIPRRFGEHVAAGLPARLQVLVDGTEPTRAVSASAALTSFVAGQSLTAQLAVAAAGPSVGPDTPRPPTVPRIVLEPRLLYNPGLKSRRFMVPGTAASILLVVTTIVTAMGLTREREIGTMEQLLVTPIRPLTLMLGKTIPYAVFGLFDIALILVVGNLLFDVPLRGSLFTVGLATLAYLLGTLALGLLISTIARTQQQALTGGFFVILPLLLLSGFLTPVEAMPDWIRPLTWISPVRYFIDIIRCVLLRDASLPDVAPMLAKLTAIGMAFLVLAALRFRRTVG
jgi:ABC-2 type transport system permease protein